MELSINRKHKLSGTTFKQSPNRSGKLTPTLIVLHDTAGHLHGRDSLAWLTNRKAKASAHLLIDREGGVTQMVHFDVAAWHAGRSVYEGNPSVNRFSLGIELVNPGKLTPTMAGTQGRSWFKKAYDVDKHHIKWVDSPTHGQGFWMPYTEEQLQSLEDVCEALVKHYDIKDITTHYAISPGRKVDVNPLFPITEFRATLGFTGSMGGASDPRVCAPRDIRR